MKRRGITVKRRIMALMTAMGLLGAMTSFEEYDVSASYGRINVITTFGITEVQQYGVPNAFIARYDRIKSKVSSYYNMVYGIEINFTQPTTQVLSPPVDVCRSNAHDFNSLCDCVITKSCQNGNPYHCTNIEYNMGELYKYSMNNNGYRLHITASMLCTNAAPPDGGNPRHSTANGLFYGMGAYKHLMVRDYDYTKDENVTNWLGNSANITWVGKTVAHEIGHIYGAVDHYNIDAETSELEGLSDDCIWGKNKEDEEIARGLVTCSYCSNTIRSNRSKYQHT